MDDTGAQVVGVRCQPRGYSSQVRSTLVPSCLFVWLEVCADGFGTNNSLDQILSRNQVVPQVTLQQVSHNQGDPRPPLTPPGRGRRADFLGPGLLASTHRRPPASLEMPLHVLGVDSMVDSKL